MEEEIEVEAGNVIEGEMIDFHFDRFMSKNRNFTDLRYVKDYQLEDLYNIYYSRKYSYEEGDPTWTDILSRFDKTLFKFLTNSDPLYCEKLLPIFYKHLNKIMHQIEEEEEEKQKQKQEQQKGEGEGESDEKGDGEGEGEGQHEGSDEIKEAQSSLTEDQQEKIEQSVDEAMAEAKKEVEKLQAEEGNQQKRVITGAGTGDGSRENADPKIVMELLNKVDLRSSAIDNFIKQTIKSFKEHFSNISKIEIESLLDAEEIIEIDSIELIAIAKKFPFLWDEISNISKQYSCVVDVFVDNSGSIWKCTVTE